MADDPGDTEDCRASDLELLRSGNFADVRIICGDRTWNCHIAILTSRSIWFRKALAGPFQEASTRQVNLKEESPMFVDLALKYIYGAGLDVESSVSDEHFLEHCVFLWHTADFLLLDRLKLSVEQAVRNYCDKRMKHLCTRQDSSRPKYWRTHKDESTPLPWVPDFAIGIRTAYQWKAEDLKAMLMEFIWVGRIWVLKKYKAVDMTLADHLKDIPALMDDLIENYACRPWMRTALWAPVRNPNLEKAERCGICDKKISWEVPIPTEAGGQVLDPFTFNYGKYAITGGWCQDCSDGDKIPWRV